jgi:hypothetical protein
MKGWPKFYIRLSYVEFLTGHAAAADIPAQVGEAGLVRERVDDLLSRPGGGGLLRDRDAIHGADLQLRVERMGIRQIVHRPSRSLAEGSGFIQHLFAHMRHTPGIAATVAESLALLGARKRASRGFEEEEAFVIGAHGVENAFARPALGGAGMQTKQGGDLGGSHPSASRTPTRLNTSLPSAHCGPVRHPLAVGRVSGRTGYTAYPAPPISRRDEEGFSSCLTCPTHRAVAHTQPEGTRRLSQTATLPAAFA